MRIHCLQAWAVGKGVYAITSHWFMGNKGKMGREWKLSCLEAVQIWSLKKHKSIGLHRKTWWIWDTCVGRNVVRVTVATRWGQIYLLWFTTENTPNYETHKSKSSHNCNPEAPRWTCSWSADRWHVQNSNNTTAERTFNFLNSGDLMTTALLEQMLLRLSWVLIGCRDEIVSNAPERALQR